MGAEIHDTGGSAGDGGLGTGGEVIAGYSACNMQFKVGMAVNKARENEFSAGVNSFNSIFGSQSGILLGLEIRTVLSENFFDFLPLHKNISQETFSGAYEGSVFNQDHSSSLYKRKQCNDSIMIQRIEWFNKFLKKL